MSVLRLPGSQDVGVGSRLWLQLQSGRAGHPKGLRGETVERIVTICGFTSPEIFLSLKSSQ